MAFNSFLSPMWFFMTYMHRKSGKYNINFFYIIVYFFQDRTIFVVNFLGLPYQPYRLYLACWVLWDYILCRFLCKGHQALKASYKVLLSCRA